MLDFIPSLRKISDAGLWHDTQSNANHFSVDQSKTLLKTRLYTEFNQIGILCSDCAWVGSKIKV